MRVLSVRQPWAWLIVVGDKDIENRSWRTTYRGPVLIHAGLTIDREAVTDFGAESRELGLPWPAEFSTGCIIGMVDLVDCVTESDSDWFGGPIGWVLANPRELDPPIPCKGRLGLFDVPEDVMRALEEYEGFQQ